MRKLILLALGAVCLLGSVWFALDNQPGMKGELALAGAAVFLVWASLWKQERTNEIPSIYYAAVYAVMFGTASFILWKLGVFHWIGRNMVSIVTFALFGSLTFATFLKKKP